MFFKKLSSSIFAGAFLLNGCNVVNVSRAKECSEQVSETQTDVFNSDSVIGPTQKSYFSCGNVVTALTALIGVAALYRYFFARQGQGIELFGPHGFVISNCAAVYAWPHFDDVHIEAGDISEVINHFRSCLQYNDNFHKHQFRMMLMFQLSKLYKEITDDLFLTDGKGHINFKTLLSEVKLYLYRRDSLFYEGDPPNKYYRIYKKIKFVKAFMLRLCRDYLGTMHDEQQGGRYRLELLNNILMLIAWSRYNLKNNPVEKRKREDFLRLFSNQYDLEDGSLKKYKRENFLSSLLRLFCGKKTMSGIFCEIPPKYKRLLSRDEYEVFLILRYDGLKFV